MLDEAAEMEKNRNRTSSTPPKSNGGAESKTPKQDAAVSKFHRAGRRRESPCPRPPFPPPDSRRKPAPQRNKTFDKRPKPRGINNNNNNADGRDRSNITTNGPGAEAGSALQQGSKKLNLNHLLNFTYSPRGSSGQMCNWGASPPNRIKWNARKPKYNKEQFLQANCQFVVRAGGDYSIHAVDPDLLVDWDAIELVRLPSQEVPFCPICLYQPVAAKMTRCGHIFCWPCILHYLSLSDKSWRKCPICFEAIHKPDLKSVVSLKKHQYAIGEKITLRLMRREKGSVFAMAKVQWKNRKGQLFGLDDAEEVVCFAKLLTASPSQILKLVVARERDELQVAFEETKNDPEICFVEAALQLLTERESKLNQAENDPAQNTRPITAIVSETIKTTDFSNEEKPQQQQQQQQQPSDESTNEEIHTEGERMPRLRQESTGSSVEDGNNNDNNVVSVEDLDIEVEEANKTSSKDVYHFYQASNGQYIYMHALNAHMLIQEYGSLESSPDTITAKIVEMEGITMTEELRRRLRYLSYLPLSCQFEVVEVQLTNAIISKQTLKAFEDEVEKRRRRRNRRARAEQRRERRIQEEQNRKLGRYPPVKLNLESRRQFPEYVPSTNDCLPLSTSPSSAQATHETNSNANSLSDFPESLSNSLEDNGSSVPSFAQMLREGKAKPDMNVVKPSKDDHYHHQHHQRNAYDSETDSENGIPVPDYHTSFGDAIEAAILKATMCCEKVEETTSTSEQQPSMGRKKKKSGKQKQLLFTTSMTRNSK